eukprot:CAMPEP_0168517666 /NCGR_PEP_ID=MMETSP0405-20121227/6196_1 /TAXON_ID=498012 /ORGANISM="Trichosphaerium sp, Strain Am-I-7 wt" /LENGTH=234 /DNA_ID=CAMNT_0008537737 /DNA_START=1513 /DNA_END=2217 /DNA_ORIENTATION=-
MTGFSCELGLGTPKSIPDAIHWYLDAGEDGDGDALNNLALLYQEQREYAKAQIFFHKSVATSNIAAQCNLGALYADGIGVKRNYAKAVRWYSRAASAGNVTAMFNMGYLNEMGLGTQRDPVGAAKWYYMAANRGSDEAEIYLSRLYHTEPDAVKFFHDMGQLLKPKVYAKEALIQPQQQLQKADIKKIHKLRRTGSHEIRSSTPHRSKRKGGIQVTHSSRSGKRNTRRGLALSD